MPRRDGMGPYGQGSFTDKGLGCCVVRLDCGTGLGLGYNRGRERRLASENRYNRSRRNNNIEDQIEFHKSRIEKLSNQLETD